MLTAGSPSFIDISAVDRLDEADFEEMLWSGTQLESPKIADMALHVEISDREGCFVMALLCPSRQLEPNRTAHFLKTDIER